MGDKNTQQESPSLEGDFCILVCTVDSFELVRGVQVQLGVSRGEIVIFLVNKAKYQVLC